MCIRDRSSIAELYDVGRGVKQDYIWAYTWYSIAAFGGAQVEMKRLDDLRAIMNPNQISEAARRIEQWLKKIKKEREGKSDDSREIK